MPKIRNNNSRFGRYLPLIFNLSDLVVVNVAFLVTVLLYPEIREVGHSMRVLWFLVNLSFLPVIVRTARRPQDYRAIRMDNVLRAAFVATGIHAMVFLSTITLLRVNIIPLKAYLTMYGIMVAGLTIWSVFTRLVLKRYRRRGYNFLRVVIVGVNSTSHRFYETLINDAGFGYRVLAFFDDDPQMQGQPKAVHALYQGGIDNLPDFVAKNAVDQIFYALPGQGDAFSKVVKAADDNVCNFYYVPQISRLVSRRFQLHEIGGLPVLSTMRNPLSRPLNRVVKRTFDIAVSSIFLCFYPLILIPVAIGIKLTSPGPIYFRQQRTGYRGKTFTCLKFRTMRVNKDSDRLQATSNDPRKTRFGDFLRRTSLDELPQFINVWRGDMSVVGPRPHMLKHTEDYTRLVDRYMVRHIVKPGITGWAQVNGYRGLTDELWKMEKRVEYDVWYIENWTFALDIKIMGRTVLNALGGEKNAF